MVVVRRNRLLFALLLTRLAALRHGLCLWRDTLLEELFLAGVSIDVLHFRGFGLACLELNQLTIEDLRILLVNGVQLLGVLVLGRVSEFDSRRRIDAVGLRRHLDTETRQIYCLLGLCINGSRCLRRSWVCVEWHWSTTIYLQHFALGGV